MTGAVPLVSVVTATFNRSAVLELALRSVIGQTLGSWELWVIGDACTDGTGDVVRNLGDPRIRFLNLPRNCGEQSGPNNEGVRRAQGRYVAFLNHDDLWFPDHLEKAVGHLEASGADLVYSVGAVISPAGEVALTCVTPSARWEPFASFPASTWVLRRETHEVVGDWRNFRSCWAAPSQDWLFRAGRAGMRMELVPEITVVLLESGARMGSYASEDATEHNELHQRLADPGPFRTELVTRAAMASAAEVVRPRRVVHHLNRAGRDWVRRACLAGGVSQHALLAVVRHRRRGGIIDRLREVRGLPPG